MSIFVSVDEEIKRRAAEVQRLEHLIATSEYEPPRFLWQDRLRHLQALIHLEKLKAAGITKVYPKSLDEMKGSGKIDGS